ncbi:FtsX-like permease family protein [Candidatus Pacearchaeota archaeon]|nr:FtsX-like permease family protein [Candidatus Pacearchaeota archaeon]
MKKNEILTAFFIAKKNIIKNKNILIFTILIISLGFISSIIIYGVLQDVGHDLQENFIETNMGHIILEPYRDNDKIENADNIIKKIKALPNILGIAKINKKAARLYDLNNNYIDTEVYIIDPEEFSQVSVIDEIIKEGSWLNKGEKNKILMGCINIDKCNEIKAFDTIDIGVGEKVRTIFNSYPETELILQGIYDHKYIEIEITSYIDEDTAMEIFSDYDSTTADQIIIRLPDRSYTQETIEEISKFEINAKISTWEEKSSRFASVLDSFEIIGDISFFLGLLISAISIYVILYINILNKKTQIGIIKAIGIKSKIIALSYVMLSFFLGVIGSIVGILLTLFMIECFKFSPIQTGVGELVPQVTIWIFWFVGFAIVLASVISGYIVSKKITKQNIIEAIFNG